MNTDQNRLKIMENTMEKIIHNSCAVTVFRSDVNGWCLKIGMNIYAGHKTRKVAIAAITKFI